MIGNSRQAGIPYGVTGEVHMLESAVDLLSDLCLSALMLLISFCIVGSTVAALRAVRPGRAIVSSRK